MLASGALWHHCGAIMSQQAVLRKILRDAPGSLRELAEEAGLAHTTLLRAESGERRVTPETVRAVVGALRRWSGRCDALADALEAAQREEEAEDG